MLVTLYAVVYKEYVQWRVTIAPDVDNYFWRAITCKQPDSTPSVPTFFVADAPMTLANAHARIETLKNQLYRLSQPPPHFSRHAIIPSLDDPSLSPLELDEQQLETLNRGWSGRALLIDEVWQMMREYQCLHALQHWKSYVQLAYLMGHLTFKSGLTHLMPRTNHENVRCARCGADEDWFEQSACAVCGRICRYCRRCLSMGKSKECSIIVIGSVKPTHINMSKVRTQNWRLTAEQAAATEKVLTFLRNPQSDQAFLLWAVTGAGKTEMIYPILAESFEQHKTMALVTPRKDVVLELDPRIRQAFPDTSIVTLYGGSEQKWHTGQLYLTTTHQLIRFESAFEWMIIDEIDAFPYHRNPMLQFAVNKALHANGKVVWLSATPPEEQLLAVRRGRLPHAIVARRYHGHPLPVPRRCAVPSLRRQLLKGKIARNLHKHILKSLQRGANLMFFVPYISHVTPLVQLLQNTYAERVAGTSSQDAARLEKVRDFRRHEYRLLVTTTILERGVTVPYTDVFVLDADDPQFDRAALIQMAGRAGRTQEDPHGHVWFCASEWTRAQRCAVNEIKQMNRLAGHRGRLFGSFFS